MTSLKTSIKTITYLSDIGCLEIQGASLVASICHLARMKKMQVVAEYVENEEIRQAVHSLGIDYLQGFLIGEPQLLVDMLDEREPVRESA
ncbi:EAL domain-containing protein [Escherichia marmotae]|nr:EAL domain-containing protein [Escherichia marmotae]